MIARQRPRRALTAREHEVVQLVADGLANKQIAARLHLSEKTIKNHLSHIFAVLGIQTRTQAAVAMARCVEMVPKELRKRELSRLDAIIDELQEMRCVLFGSPEALT